MKLTEFLDDAVGLTLVHWDVARGLTCFWNGSSIFLEYRVTDAGVEHGDAWSVSTRPAHSADAVELARAHYGLSTE